MTDIDTQAVVVREAQAVAPTTAAQAKVDAVAQLTMKAYDKASMLTLTPEEIKGLAADFPDDAFKPGAAGKEHLIYIEHAFLRDRLNSVFGPGQWALIPRSRWGEDFTLPARNGKPETKGTRIYVEAMLLIRGCFVSEAIGEMEYYPSNHSQNYGDAVEGAKTAALRRCAKELGIGLQAWKKDFGDGWWKRHNARPSSDAGKAPSSKAAPAPPPTPKPQAPRVSSPSANATQDQKNRMAEALLKDYEQTELRDYAIKAGIILETENLDAWPLTFVPTTQKQLKALQDAIRAFTDGMEAINPFVTHAPTSPNAHWRSFPVPFGKSAGVLLGELDKKKLYGFWANFAVEEEYNGKPRKADQIERDTQFRTALDAAGQHYEFTKND